MLRKHVVLLVSLLSLAVALSGFAPVAMADDDDPPSRVARLAYAQGSVSFQPAGTDDWVDARINRPVTTGDQLWSDRDGRVELQLDGSVIRLSNNTGFSFLNLSDYVTQIQLNSGTILVHVRRFDQNETYEVDTPNLAFTIERPGTYRISVSDDGNSTAIRIRSGAGEVTGEGAAYSLDDNDSYSFSGNDQLYAEPNDPDYNDEFDSWASQRDRRWENSQSARYVSADVVGYEDLDDQGDWRPTPEYGAVWFPRTAYPDWAPYHYGHWAYIDPWGYTWVDDEPWGFAPFHYGRWVSYQGRWGWVPAPPPVQGVVYVRPVYAPALVAWVGGPHFAIGVGVGGGGYGPGVNVGWFPLGPREVYVPSYRVSRTYVENVNVSNTRVTNVVVNNYYSTTIVEKTTVTNVKYVNQGVRGAVTATTPQAFTSAQPVAKNVVKVDEREVAAAPVRASTPPAVPAKQAVLGTTKVAATKPPAAVERRAVVAKVAPPPPPPSFEKKQEAIKNNGGKPLSVAQAKQSQPVAAARPAPVKIAPPAPKPVPARTQANRAGQPNRPGQPGGQPGQPQANQPQPAHPPNASKPAQPPEANRPPQPAETNRPPEKPANPSAKPNEANRPAQLPNRPSQPPEANRPPVHPNEMPPPAARPAPPQEGNAQQDRKQQQEQEQLRAKQEQERQRVQQQQEKQHQELEKQQADAARKQQVEQQHERQTQQLQQKQQEQQKALDQKQQQEHDKKSKSQPKDQKDQHNQ